MSRTLSSIQVIRYQNFPPSGRLNPGSYSIITIIIIIIYEDL